jgi:cytidyltransferase-like protein
MKFSFLFSCLFLLIFNAHAGYIEDVTLLPGQRVAFYVGTFDPIHKGHIAAMQHLLDIGEVDYVVALPNNAAYHKPNRTNFSQRLESMQLALGDSPRILIPKSASTSKMPIALTTLKQLKKSCPSCNFYGVKGSDVSFKRFSNLIDEIALSDLKGWYLYARSKADLPKLNKMFPSEKYKKLVSDFPELSSSKIKTILAENPDFYDLKNLDGVTPVDDFLPKPVQKYISENNLYRAPLVTRDGSVLPYLPSFDPKKVNWKSGQLIGFSSRAGGVPFIAQVGSGSPLDHVGIVSVEPAGTFVYEFTNRGGVIKIPLEKTLENVRGKSGHIMAHVGELKNPPSPEELKKMFAYADHLIEIQPAYGVAKIPNGPKSCSQFVNGAFKHIGYTIGKVEAPENFKKNEFNGFIEKYWKKFLLDTEVLLSPKSFFQKDVKVVASNLPHGLEWTSEEALMIWKADGDFSRVARMVAIDANETLTPAQVKAKTDELIRNLESQLPSKSPKPSCGHMKAALLSLIQ